MVLIASTMVSLKAKIKFILSFSVFLSLIFQIYEKFCFVAGHNGFRGGLNKQVYNF